jgi:hypothetical protein
LLQDGKHRAAALRSEGIDNVRAVRETVSTPRDATPSVSTAPQQTNAQMSRKINQFLGRTPDPKVTTGERVGLRSQLRLQQKASKEGFGAGKAEATARINKAIREKTADVADIKQQLTRYAKENLSLKDRGKMLDRVRTAKTHGQLQKAMDMADRLGGRTYHSSLVSNIKKELANIRPTATKTGVRKGKFTPEIQKSLDEARSAFSNKTNAQAKIQDILTNAEGRAITPQEQRSIDLLRLNDTKNMSISELEDALANVRSLKETGRTVNEQLAFNRQTAIQRNQDYIVDSMAAKRGGVAPAGQTVKDAGEGIFGSIRTGAVRWGQGLDQLVDVLSSGKYKKNDYLSPLHRSLARPIHKASGQFETGVIDKARVMSDQYQNIFGTGRAGREAAYRNTVKQDMGVFKNADGDRVRLEFSQNELYPIYQWSKNTNARARLKDEMRWTDEMINAVDRNLDPNVRKWADWQMEELYPRIYDESNEVFRRTNGFDMPFVGDNYTPIVSDDKITNVSSLLRREADSYTSTRPGAIKKRGDIGSLKLGIDGDQRLLKYINDMEVYKAFEEPVSNFRSVMSSREVRNAIKQNHGSKFNQRLDTLINDVALQGNSTGKNIEAIDILRRNFTRSVLGANLSLVPKQLMSFPAYATEIGLTRLGRGMTEFGQNPVELGRQMYRKSEFLRGRSKGFERDVVELGRKKSTSRVLRGKKNVGEKAMLPTKAGDVGAIYPGFYATYRYHPTEGYDALIARGVKKSEADRRAITIAEEISSRTQQSGRMQDLTEMARGGSTEKLFTMFQTAPTQYYRILTKYTRDLATGRGNPLENARNIVIAWALLPSMFQFASDGFNINPDNQKRAIGLGPLNGIPAMGSALSSLAQGFDGAGIPGPIQNFGQTWNLVQDIAKDPEAHFGKDGIFNTAEEVAEKIAKISGVPFTAVRNSARGVRDVARGYSETKTGNVSFMQDTNPLNIARGAVFGRFGTPQGQQYVQGFNNEDSDRPLFADDSDTFRKLPREDREKFFREQQEKYAKSRERKEVVDKIVERLNDKQKKDFEAYRAAEFDEDNNFVYDPFRKYVKSALLQDNGVFSAAKEEAIARQKIDGKPVDPIFNLSESQRRRILHDRGLVPGAKDPTLSFEMRQQDWYQNFRSELDEYYRENSTWAKAQGYQNRNDPNPYPTPSTQVQAVLDEYNALPKGDGPRGGNKTRRDWILANPEKQALREEHFSLMDEWTNNKRRELGLDPLPEDQYLGMIDKPGTGGGSGRGGGGGRGGRTASQRQYLGQLLGSVNINPEKVRIRTKAQRPQFRVQTPSGRGRRFRRVRLG